MRIPYFEHIHVKNYDLYNLVSKFRQSKIYFMPVVIHLEHFENKEEVKLAIDNIFEALVIIKRDPIFPYPLYVITPLIERHHTIDILKSEADIPKFYDKKPARLKAKESNLMQKITLLTEKAINIKASKKLNSLSGVMKKQKQLFELCKEYSYYEQLQEKLEKEGNNE